MLRVLVPFALGVLLQRMWSCWWGPTLVIAAASGLYILILRKSQTPQGRLVHRHHFIIPLALSALALGWLSAIVHEPPMLDKEQYRGRTIAGRVEDVTYTDFSMRLTVQILDDSLPPCKVLVSTGGCDYNLQAGDIVAWRAALEPVGNMGNPEEMDYAGWLLDGRSIRYQQHIDKEQLAVCGQSPTLRTRLSNARRHLALQVFNTPLQSGTQQFIVAMLLGNGNLIDKATRQEFSAAGTAHVLALSGLHVGFIALIIWWLLFPLDYLRLRKLRLAITLTAITLFAVFTGLSPSVVRASIMTATVFASLIFYRRSASLNALALAALIILVFSPSALFSVGFQLSFVTVAAVLILGRLPQRFRSGNKVLDSITSMVVTSVAALLATVALSAHYFHMISYMSVLANLLVLPVLPVFMILGALFLLVTAAGMHWGWLNRGLDCVYDYIRWAAQAVNGIPFSHAGGVYVSWFGVAMYFTALVLVALWFYRRHYRLLLEAGCAIAVMIGHSLIVDAMTPSKGLVVFNSFSSTPMLYFDSGKGWVWTPDEEEPDSAAFTRYYSGFLARYGIGDLHFIGEGDTLRLDDALMRPPHALVMGQRYVAVGSGKWKKTTAARRLQVDDVLVTKRYHGTAAKLLELYDFNRLIISGAMHTIDLAPLLHDCDSLGITVHDLNQDGAVFITE